MIVGAGASLAPTGVDVGGADVVADDEVGVLPLARRAVERAEVGEVPGIGEAGRVRLSGREVLAAERVAGVRA